MFSWLADVAGYFASAWDFFLNYIETFFTAITTLTGSFGFTMAITSYMPAIVASAIYVFFAIYLIKFLLGR